MNRNVLGTNMTNKTKINFNRLLYYENDEKGCENAKRKRRKNN